MNSIKKTTALVTLALILLGASGFFMAGTAVAAPRGDIELCGNGIDDDGDSAIDEAQCQLSPTGAPTSANGVVPETWSDNPNCSQMGYGYGFKLDGSPTGTFTLTGANGDLTGGAPSDSFNTVTVSSSDGIHVSWSSTLPMDAVFVKGGPIGGNLYVYNPESEGPDSGLSTPNAASGISHIEFCYDYELDVTKTASTSFTRTYAWDITKEADATYDLFSGDTQDHKYTVSVDKTGFTDSNWAVAGSIDINNNTPFDATIESVTDAVSGVGAVAVDCGVGVSFPYVLASGGKLTCSYSTGLPNGTNRTNTATVTTSGNVGGGDAEAAVDFANATINEVNDSVSVTDTNDAFGGPKSASDDASWMYEVEFACDADEGSHINTARVIGDGDVVLDSDIATVTINCYDLDVSKDAQTSLTRTYAWDITKEADATYNLFSGDTQDHKYTVSVDKTGFTDSDWAVAGSIYVENNTPLGAEITDVTDLLPGSSNLTVDCGVAFPYTLPADDTLTCSYSADLPDAATRTNTGTATLQNYDYASDGSATAGGTTDFSGEAAVDFTNATITKINDEVTVTDTNAAFVGPKSASDDASWMYEVEFACDEDEGKHINTAKVIGDDDVVLDSDTATVTINCYDLTVTKDAEGTYDERHTWDIEKSVSPTSQSGFPGDELSWEWKVTLSESSVDENFSLSDDITISNVGNPIAAEITSVADVVSGLGLSDVNASVDCNVTFPHTIPAGGTLECTYDAGTADLRAYELNTATATLQNYDYASDGTAAADGTTDFSGTASVNYTANVLNGSAVVDDDQEPAFNPDGLTVYAGDGPWTWTETQSHECSTDRADYGESGSYGDTLYNTATVTGSNGQTDSADADTTYTCYASFVDILKTTNGSIDPTKDIRFKLYDGDGNDLNDEVSTLDDPDGQLQFQTALVPGASYTVCESPVPAGYTFEITVDGGNVLTYAGPPGEANPTGEIQCFDFVAADSPTTLLFEVNNSFPGGAPRTPGYWKNWNTCSGGNQADTAEKLGGVAEGVFLLDDLLPQTVGDLEVTTCEVGVSILDSRNINNGTKQGNDGAYILARSYLAALLNQDAGACDPDGLTFDVAGVGDDLTFQEVLNAAQALLDAQDFDGTGRYLPPNDRSGDRDIALALYGIIDAYNNSQLCTGEPSH